MMIYQARVLEISEVRAIASQVVSEWQVAHDVVEARRDAFQAMCQEAAQSGTTTADVAKALLSPVLQRGRGFDCPTCKEQRAQTEEEQLRRWQTES